MKDFEKAKQKYIEMFSGAFDEKDFSFVLLGFETGYKEALKEEVEVIPYQIIIDACNEVLGKKFKCTSTIKTFIRARWKEGMRLEDFKQVCVTKKSQWNSDPAMRIYLRPQTLFGTKMDAYLNEAPAQQEVPDWM